MIAQINRVLQVRSGEWPIVAAAGGLSATATAAVVLIKVSNDALFLGAYPATWLPPAVALSSLVMVVASALFGVLGDRIGRDRLHVLTPATVAGLLVLGRLCLVLRLPGYIFLQYIVLSIVCGLIPYVSWSLAAGVADTRALRRLMPLLNGLGSIGAFSAGVLSRLLSRPIGAENLLLLAMALSVAAFVFAQSCWERTQARAAPARKPPPGGFWRTATDGLGLIHRNTLMRWTTLFVICGFVAFTVIDYQFKTSLKLRYERDAIAAFLGNYYAVANVVAFVLQLFVSGRLLNRFGLTGAIGARPLFVLVLGVLAMNLPGFWSFAALRFADWILTLTWFDLGLHLAFTPIPAQRASRVKLAHDGAIKPLVVAGTSTLLVALAPVLGLATTPMTGLATLTWIPLAICVVWFVGSWRIRAHYVRELARSMDSRLLADREDVLAGPLDDQELLNCVSRALASDNAENIKFALAIAQDTHARRLWEPVFACLDYPDEEVRARAATTLVRLDPQRAGPALRARLSEPDLSPAWLSHLLRSLGEAEDEAALEWAHRFVSDPRLPVKCEAAVMLFRLGGLDGIIAAVEQMSALRHGDATARAALAEIVGRLGVTHLERTLSTLLHDDDPVVRRAALQAAALAGSERLLRDVVRMLADADWREVCETALRDAGPRGAEAVRQVLTSEAVSAETTASAARVLRSCPTGTCTPLVLSWLSSESPAVRVQAARTLAVFQSHGLRFDLHPVRAFFEFELRTLYECRAVLETQHGVVRRQLELRVERGLERAFLALGLLHDARDMDGVQAALRSGDEKLYAHALEYLETTLRDPREKAILPLVESETIKDAYRRAEPLLGLSAWETQSVARLAQSDPWLRRLLEPAPEPGIDPVHLRIATYLAEQPWLATQDIAALYRLAERGTLRPFAAGDVLIERGATAAEYYIVLDGCLEVTGDGAATRSLLPGQAFNEVETLAGDTASGTVRCSAPTHCWVLSRAALDRALLRDARLAQAAIARLLGALRVSSEEESQLRARAPEAKPC